MSAPKIKAPAHIEPFVEVLGEDGALAFLLEHGGGYLYLTEKPTSKNPVAVMFGVEKAAKLGAKLRHPHMRVPLAKPWMAKLLASKGMGTHAIARKLHMSDTSVRNWIGTREDRQIDLFAANDE
jgi:hypothetical protein